MRIIVDYQDNQGNAHRKIATNVERHENYMIYNILFHEEEKTLILPINSVRYIEEKEIKED